MTEVWACYIEFPGYEISNYGKVMNTHGKPLYMSKAGRKKEYPAVRLCYKKKRAHLVLHKLVFTIFQGEIPYGYQVDHVDEDLENSSLENLRLLTHDENQTRRKRYAKEEADEHPDFHL